MKPGSGARAKRILKYAGAGILALVVLACAWGAFLALRPDAPPFDDSALMPNRPSVPDNQNGYVALVEALSNPEAQGLEKRNDLDRLEKPQKLKNLRILLLEKKYHKQIVEVTNALDLPSFVYVPEKNPLKNHMDVLMFVRNLARLQNELARREFESNDRESAMERITWNSKLAHALQMSHGDLLHLMIGTRIHSYSLETMDSLANQRLLSHDDLGKLAGLLSTYQPGAAAWRQSVQTLYEFNKTILLNPEKHLEGEPRVGITFPIYNPVEIVRYSYPAYLGLARIGDEPYTIKSKNRVYDGWRDGCHSKNSPFFFLYLVINPNRHTAQTLSCIGMPNYVRALDRLFLQNASMRMMQVKLAALAYRLDHGELPGTIDALVPEYLDAVPPDPFTGKPLLYDAKKGVIYSAGFDSEDNGGEAVLFVLEGDYSPDDFRKQKDLVLKIDGPVNKERDKGMNRMRRKEQD